MFETENPKYTAEYMNNLHKITTQKPKTEW